MKVHLGQWNPGLGEAGSPWYSTECQMATENYRRVSSKKKWVTCQKCLLRLAKAARRVDRRG